MEHSVYTYAQQNSSSVVHLKSACTAHLSAMHIMHSQYCPQLNSIETINCGCDCSFTIFFLRFNSVVVLLFCFVRFDKMLFFPSILFFFLIKQRNYLIYALFKVKTKRSFKRNKTEKTHLNLLLMQKFAIQKNFSIMKITLYARWKIKKKWAKNEYSFKLIWFVLFITFFFVCSKNPIFANQGQQ